METQTIIQLVNAVGFPIALIIVLIFGVYKASPFIAGIIERHVAAIEKLVESGVQTYEKIGQLHELSKGQEVEAARRHDQITGKVAKYHEELVALIKDNDQYSRQKIEEISKLLSDIVSERDVK